MVHSTVMLILWDRKGNVFRPPAGGGMLYGADFRLDIHRGTRLYLMKMWNSHKNEPSGVFMPAYWTWA